MNLNNEENNKIFFKELHNDNDDLVENDDMTCYITGEVLSKHSVQLECGHKFNYKPLFNSICSLLPLFKGESYIINHTYIICPYCRHKQNTILPYYEELNLPRIMNINSTSIEHKYVYKDLKYDYIYCCGKCDEFIDNQLCKNDVVTQCLNTNKYYCKYHILTNVKTQTKLINNQKKKEAAIIKKKENVIIKKQIVLKQQEDIIIEKTKAKMAKKENALKLKEEAILLKKEQKQLKKEQHKTMKNMLIIEKYENITNVENITNC